MAELERITVYPVKSLDREDQDVAEITPAGTLAGDRQYAIVTGSADESFDPDVASAAANGQYVNAKRTDAVHRLRSTLDQESQTLTLCARGDQTARTFDLDERDDVCELNAWLSDYFDEPATLRREPTRGHPDHRRYGLTGPSIVSTATLREVASWFPDLDTDDVRRRFRANLEIGGVPPFWEDRLYADHGEAVAFRIGDVRFEGVEPCQRCVVPVRDPDTGAEYDGFRQTFIRNRKRTRPEWLDSDRFDHDFRLTVITNVPESQGGKTIQIGDAVEVLERHSYDVGSLDSVTDPEPLGF